MPKDDQYNPKGNTYIGILLHIVVPHNNVFLTYIAVRIQYVLRKSLMATVLLPMWFLPVSRKPVRGFESCRSVTF